MRKNIALNCSCGTLCSTSRWQLDTTLSGDQAPSSLALAAIQNQNLSTQCGNSESPTRSIFSAGDSHAQTNAPRASLLVVLSLELGPVDLVVQLLQIRQTNTQNNNQTTTPHTNRADVSQTSHKYNHKCFTNIAAVLSIHPQHNTTQRSTKSTPKSTLELTPLLADSQR